MTHKDTNVHTDYCSIFERDKYTTIILKCSIFVWGLFCMGSFWKNDTVFHAPHHPKSNFKSASPHYFSPVSLLKQIRRRAVALQQTLTPQCIECRELLPPPPPQTSHFSDSNTAVTFAVKPTV